MLYIFGWQAELLLGSPDAEACGRHTNVRRPQVQSRGPSWNLQVPLSRIRHEE
jgi:hypothetical protein